jgi:hypothetical protein
VKKAGRPSREDAEARVAAAQKAALEGRVVSIEDAVLAIGRFPKAPPAWAIEACVREYQTMLHGEPKDRRMFRVLDCMWDFFINDHRESVRNQADQISQRVPWGRVQPSGPPHENVAPPAPYKRPSLNAAMNAAIRHTGITLEKPTIRAAWNKEAAALLSRTGEESMFDFLALPDTPRGRRAVKRSYPPRYPWLIDNKK